MDLPVETLGPLFSKVIEYAHSTSVQVFVGCCFGYALYYFTHIAKKPELFCKEGKFKRLLLRECPVLQERFCPTFWLSEGRAQSMAGTFLKGRPTLKYDELEDIQCADGGEIHLHWKMGEGCQSAGGGDEERPIVLIMPGLTGNSHANYALHFIKQAQAFGYRCVTMNYRGHVDDLKTPKLYCACATEDLGAAVDRIKTRFPKAPLSAVGVSLGGMILFHYLASRGQQSDIVGALIVSVPFNPHEACKEISLPLNHILFDRYLARRLVSSVSKYLHLFRDVVNWEKVMNSQSIREFDTHFTSSIFNFRSLDHYYDTAALYDKLHKIYTPILFVNASDDPFSPLRCIPTAEAAAHDHIAIALTKRGGHVGFCEGVSANGPGYVDRLFCQYMPALFNCREELA